MKFSEWIRYSVRFKPADKQRKRVSARLLSDPIFYKSEENLFTLMRYVENKTGDNNFANDVAKEWINYIKSEKRVGDRIDRLSKHAEPEQTNQTTEEIQNG